ncbi:MAG: type IV pilus secretin PilQ, partial [Proteobacteria bacterium]|nr:type IV pilus secretin PilQ [Pseudomonadota bacterium]
RVEPLLTKVVQISFADSEDLKKNLETFLAGKTDGKTHGSVMVDKHTKGIILHATMNDIERILPLIEELDKPTRQILIEANIVETSKETARALGIQWGGVYKEVMGGDKTEWVTSGSASTGVLGGTTAVNPTSGLAVNFPTSGTSITGTAMTLGYVIENLGKHVLAVQLSALETEGKLNILSSPSITTLDNQEAVIASGREITFISGTTVLGGEYVPPAPIKAVLSLKVTPHVIDDKTIKIAIETTKDELDSASSTSNKQVIIKKTATTTVVLFDGQTTVIGGLSKETTGESESGIPWLRKIPLLGYLFKGEYKSREMEEILIFITPHILKEKVMDESQE